MKDEILDRLANALASLEAAELAAQARIVEMNAEFEDVKDGDRRPTLTQQLERTQWAALAQVREELREQLLPIHDALRLLLAARQ